MKFFTPSGRRSGRRGRPPRRTAGEHPREPVRTFTPEERESGSALSVRPIIDAAVVAPLGLAEVNEALNHLPRFKLDLSGYTLNRAIGQHEHVPADK